MADNVNSHYFHAEAHALTGALELPFRQDIKKQAFVKLQGQLAEWAGAEQEQRSYYSQNTGEFRVEGIISYASARTQVSGHASKKHDGASVTLSTSVVENLNVLIVVTADRVVAQVSTTHFPDVYAPSVTFLGTHFENLRIARHRAEPFLNLGLCGEKPGGKGMYVDQGTTFMKAVASQYQRLAAGLKGLDADDPEVNRLQAPEGSVATQYRGFDLDSDGIGAQAKVAREGDKEWDGVTCSLVENVDIKDISAKGADGKPIQIPAPAKPFGHVIHIPDFGNVFLAELTVNHNTFNLTMIRLELGCIADARVKIATCEVNGKGSGGH